jgi:hypothetical protein
MLLSADEQETIGGFLWLSAQLQRLAFGHDSTRARLLLRVVRALDRGEAVQRAGGWVREGDGLFRTTDRPAGSGYAARDDPPPGARPARDTGLPRGRPEP